MAQGLHELKASSLYPGHLKQPAQVCSGRQWTDGLGEFKTPHPHYLPLEKSPPGGLVHTHTHIHTTSLKLYLRMCPISWMT